MGDTSKCGQELLSPIWEKVILQPEGGQLGGLRDWGCTLRKCIVAAAFSIDQSPESRYWTSSPPTERPQKLNPSAGWHCQNGPRRGQFWSQMSTWTLGNRVRATCASSELCGLTSLTRTMQKNRVLSSKNAPKNSRSHLSNDLSF